MSSRKVAAVIVTYNRLGKLKDAIIRSLEADFSFVVVVNNASTDGTSEWLESLNCDRLKVVALPANVGGAGGFHFGFDFVVRNLNVDWLVCFDDDAYPHVDAIQKFNSLILPPEIIGVAAAVYLPSGDISEMNRPSRNPFVSLHSFWATLTRGRLGFHVQDSEYRNVGLVDIDFSSFVGCFIRVDAIEPYLGLPRKELFIYADDIIYTYGIGQAGFKHCFAPEVQFFHDCETLREQVGVYKPMWKAYYTYRNGLELYRLIAGPVLFYPIAVLKLLSWFAKARYYERPTDFLRLLLIAWWHGVSRRFSLSHVDVVRLAADQQGTK